MSQEGNAQKIGEKKLLSHSGYTQECALTAVPSHFPAIPSYPPSPLFTSSSKPIRIQIPKPKPTTPC